MTLPTPKTDGERDFARAVAKELRDFGAKWAMICQRHATHRCTCMTPQECRQRMEGISEVIQDLRKIAERLDGEKEA